MKKTSNLNRSFRVGAISLLVTTLGVSSNGFTQTTSADLKNLIEYQSTYAQYNALTEDYDTQLKQLG